MKKKKWNRIYQWSAGRIRRRAEKRESLEGNVTYEELKSGDKVILDRALLHFGIQILKWEIKLKLNIHDGDNTFQKRLKWQQLVNMEEV